MPEELQGLLDRIQKEGVDKAEARSAEIVAAAQAGAAEITADAAARATATLAQAERDAAAFVQRAEKSLQQAARDVVLSVGDAVTAALQTLARDEVDAALTTQTLQQMLVKVAESYCARNEGTAGLDVLLGEKDCRALAESLKAKLGAKLAAGVDLVPEKGVVSGFRVAVKGQHVQHDFTGEAIAEAMSQLLRPQIAEIVQNAIRDELLLPGGKSAGA